MQIISFYLAHNSYAYILYSEYLENLLHARLLSTDFSRCF